MVSGGLFGFLHSYDVLLFEVFPQLEFVGRLRLSFLVDSSSLTPGEIMLFGTWSYIGQMVPHSLARLSLSLQ